MSGLYLSFDKGVTLEDATTKDWAYLLETAINNFQEDIAQVTSSLTVLAIADVTLNIQDNFTESLLKRIEERSTEEQASSFMMQKLKSQIENREYINIIYRQATVALWSSLESFIYDFLVVWLKHEPSAWDKEAVGKIKISIRDFILMSEEERRYFVIDSMKQNTGSSLKQGVGVFESLLRSFGLGGKVDIDNGVGRTIMELSNTRNVIVHKRGIVDKRMADNCDWLDLQIGDQLVISSEKFGEFTSAVGAYVQIIFERVKNYKIADQ